MRPINRLLRLNPRQDFQKEKGYISTPSGPESITASLYPDLERNLISTNLARDLNLVIAPLEHSNGEVWVELGDDHREECVGTVSFEWGTGSLGGSRNTFTVHCLVCEHNVGDLIFGEEFDKKKEHYEKRFDRGIK